MRISRTRKGIVDNKPIIGLDNGLTPIRRQAIMWTNADWFTDTYMRH